MHWDGALKWATTGNLDVRGEVQTISVPALMVAGDLDVYLSFNLDDYRSIPGCRLHVFHDVGHFLPYQIPEKLAQLVQHFVDGVLLRTKDAQ